MRKIIAVLSVFLSLSLVFIPEMVLFATGQENTDIIEYGTIIEENSVSINATSNEYTIEEITPKITTYEVASDEEEINSYVNPVKVEEEAGTHVINYNNETTTVEYNGETNKLISKSDDAVSPSVQTDNSNSEYFTVEEGVITSATEANVITIGGTEEINYMYPTIEDAYNKTNGVTVDGGAEYGSYSETITYKRKDFVHVTISGFEGYMYLEDVQIIPSYIDMNTSYYFTEDDVWYFASATDPLVSSQYMVMPLSDAPEWAEEDVKYYSDDTETFTIDEYMAPASYTDYQNVSYFQNLSLRSTTYYTAAELKSFLTYKGKSTSKYYNSTQAFIDAQNEFGVNGLLLFSMANVEGAYGTSTYSKQCNNFFGRSAFDSDPNQACQSHNFPQPEDGIMAQAIFLSLNYMDQSDWRYEGSYVGSKAGGLNVHYASDPNWGQSIASVAYECDKYLGGKDNNNYKIVEINGDVPVYTTSAMTTTAKAQGVYMCDQYKTQCIDADNPNSYVEYYIGRQTTMPVRVVVTGETSNAYEIQVETGKNLGNSGFVTWTYAETGDYPNYEGHNHGAEGQPDENYVSSGYINFANDYSSMSANQFWIPKTYNGNATTTVVANNPIKSPVDDFVQTDSYTYYSNGNIKTKTSVIESDGKVTQKITYTYDSVTGKEIDYLNECYNSKGQRTYYRHIIHESDGSIKYDCKITYTSSAVKTSYNQYWYDSNGKLTQKTERSYTNGVETHYLNQVLTSGKQTYYRHIDHESDGSVSYDRKQEHNSNGIKTRDTQITYYPSGTMKQKIVYTYDSITGNKVSYVNDCYYSNGVKSYYRKMNYNNGKLIYDLKISYNEKGTVTSKYERYY